MKIRQSGIPAKKILVVDDEESIRFFISQVLTAAGFDVMTAKNGTQAWELFQQNGYDLVITDFHIPGINGLRLAENIKRRCPEIAVILISGSDLDQIRSSGGLQNIDYLVSKPFMGADIRDIVLRSFDELPSIQGGQLHPRP